MQMERDKNRNLLWASQSVVEDPCISYYFHVYIVAGLKEKCNGQEPNILYKKSFWNHELRSSRQGRSTVSTRITENSR